jgi:hypothetical protein
MCDSCYTGDDSTCSCGPCNVTGSSGWCTACSHFDAGRGRPADAPPDIIMPNPES